MTAPKLEILYPVLLKKLDGLDHRLCYHSKEHTMDVIKQTATIAMQEGVIDSHNLALVQIAALYHDAGFLHSYSDHEIHSCKIFIKDAEEFAFSESDKQIITALIMATRMPQHPNNLLEKIICDADLDYLGRPDFFELGNRLKMELLQYNLLSDDKEWLGKQITFLQNHQYHTNSSKVRRAPLKQNHLQILLAMI